MHQTQRTLRTTIGYSRTQFETVGCSNTFVVYNKTDFSKAFNTVNHKILLSKLYHYGIRGIPHDWFRNYLHNRTQFVKIGSSQSNAETITCGIPHGSTLVLYYSCFTSMTYLIALKVSFRFVYLLMIQICFLQVITCYILSPL